jgi:hypothetical protein
MTHRHSDITKTLPKMAVLPDRIEKRSDISHVPSFRDILSRISLDVTAMIYDENSKSELPILNFISSKLSVLAVKRSKVYSLATKSLIFDLDLQIKATHDRDILDNLQAKRSILLDQFEYEESDRDRVSAADILRVRQTTDMDFNRLSINDRVSPLYAASLLICGFNHNKAIAILPYLTFKREYRIEIIKSFDNGAIGLYRLECDAKIAVDKPYQLPLSQADRMGLKIESRSLERQNLKQSSTKVLHDGYSHVLSKENHLNRFQFTSLGIEILFSDSLKGFNKQSKICAIYAKNIRLSSDVCGTWQIIGYLDRITGDRIVTTLDSAKIKTLFPTVPNALKALGLYAVDCLRYRMPSMESNLHSVNYDPLFWQQFNMYPIDCIADNAAIKMQYKKAKK